MSAWGEMGKWGPRLVPRALEGSCLVDTSVVSSKFGIESKRRERNERSGI